jgi:hypothetical protein
MYVSFHFQAIQHSSLEIRVLACDAIYYISQNTQDISTLFLKMTTSELLPLTKEKNTSIKFAAEVSLVSLMKSGNDQNRYQVSELLKTWKPQILFQMFFQSA